MIPIPQNEPGTSPSDAHDSSAPGLADADDFVAAYERHYRRVAAYVLRRVSDHDLADELAGEVFLRAFRNRRQFRGVVKVSSWLLGIASHVVYRHVRRRRIEQRLLRMIGRARDAHSDPDLRSEDVDELRRVRALIDRLPSIQQKVVSLHCIEGLALKETALALGIAEGTAKSRLSRARARLRAELGDDARPLQHPKATCSSATCSSATRSSATRSSATRSATTRSPCKGAQRG